jgi:sugar (pentulose or hexulose) kinase
VNSPASANSDAIWIGIDLGTQSVRVLAVDDRGKVLGIGSQPLTSQRDGPRHEQNPDDWWKAVAAASKAALKNLPTKAIRGLAVDATSGTILLVNATGRAITPGLMYDDGRASEETKWANAVGATLWAELGYNKMQASWGLPKLLWLLRENRRLASGTQLAHQSDFINRRLAGHAVATDTSNALKTGVDSIRQNWPEKIFDDLDVPRTVLPSVVRPGELLGTVCAQASEETGIPEGTPIIAGMTDGCAAQIGAGALRPGSWNSVLGTTLVLKGVSKELIRDPLGVVYSHRSPDGNWLPGGASSVGAGILGKHFPGRDLEAMNQKAAEHESDVVVYPLLSKGERFPFQASEAEGFMLGAPRDEIDLYAALLQGVGFMERLCFDYLDFLGAPTGGELLLTGGGAKSRAWCQLRADILGRTVSVPENAESVLGMAILAAANGRQLAETAEKMVRIRERMDPRPEKTKRFNFSYLKLVNELLRREWIQPELALHARKRAGK